MTEATAPDMPKDVAAAFAALPAHIRPTCYRLREIIQELADEDQTIGPLTECLKWGEPSWLTETSKSGTTIRLGGSKKHPDLAFIYFNCQTSLIGDCKDLFPDHFLYDGKRGLGIDPNARLDEGALKICLRMALTYHLNKKNKR